MLGLGGGGINFDSLYETGAKDPKPSMEDMAGMEPTEAELMREKYGTFNQARPTFDPANRTGAAVPSWWGNPNQSAGPSPIQPGGQPSGGRIPMVQNLSARGGQTIVGPQRALANALRGGGNG